MYINRYSPARYINPLTDFGFKRLFGSEPNKALLIDFLNVILPKEHTIGDLTFRNNEAIGNTVVDRKAVFDIYCESKTGERFIVEIQKAKQNYFKDRSVYYSTFPIRQQAPKGEWNFQLSPVYTVGVLDFVFDDHKDDATIVHTVELKDQNCEVFYKKLKFIYIELPKFTKTIDELETHFDKWLFLLRHLTDIDNPPPPLQEETFQTLFEAAELANYSPAEQNAYAESLKHYRDLTNVVSTSREEGREEGAREEGRQTVLRLIKRRIQKQFGSIPDSLEGDIESLDLKDVEALGEVIFDLSTVAQLETWLNNRRSNRDR